MVDMYIRSCERNSTIDTDTKQPFKCPIQYIFIYISVYIIENFIFLIGLEYLSFALYIITDLKKKFLNLLVYKMASQ